MSVLGSGDGWPEGRPRDPVPGLPPEWGPIVIPDDPAELADEAEAVRRELAFSFRAAAPAPGPPAPPVSFAAVRPVALMMAVALLTTLVSLFVVTWPTQQRQPALQRSRALQSPANRSLPALDLLDDRGKPVPLRGLLPAVIVVADGCACAEQIADLAERAPAAVTVAAVSSGRTKLQPVPNPDVRVLADPASELRGLLAVTPAQGIAGALMVARSGEIVRTLSSIADPDTYRADLEQLAVY